MEGRVAVTTFSPGFRLSAVDLGVVTLGAVGAVASAFIDSSWSLAIGLPVAHFFLFCNVYGVGWQRINPRLPEWWAENGPATENAE